MKDTDSTKKEHGSGVEGPSVRGRPVWSSRATWVRELTGRGEFERKKGGVLEQGEVEVVVPWPLTYIFTHMRNGGTTLVTQLHGVYELTGKTSRCNLRENNRNYIVKIRDYPLYSRPIFSF